MCFVTLLHIGPIVNSDQRSSLFYYNVCEKEESLSATDTPSRLIFTIPDVYTSLKKLQFLGTSSV